MQKPILYFWVLVVLLTFGCSKNFQPTESFKLYSKASSGVKLYFDFDEVNHYHFKGDEWELGELLNRPDSRTKEENKLFYILTRDDLPGSVPKSINDKRFIKDVKKFYSEKKIVNKEVLGEISGIFSEKLHEPSFTHSFAPIYYDILIFKKRNKVVGISKLYLIGGFHHTVGSRQNIVRSGQNVDFDRIKKILNK